MNIQINHYISKFVGYLKRKKIWCLSYLHRHQIQISPEKSLHNQKCFQAALSKNPYLQSKALWNDMYGDLEDKLCRSQRLNMLFLGVIAIALIGFVIIAGQSKVEPIPFIIHGNEVVTVADTRSRDYQGLQPKLAIYFIKQFIRNVRSVSTDGTMNAVHKIAALSFVKNDAVEILKEFYEKHDPNVVALKFVKDISITSILKVSLDTFNVRWREDWRNNRTGEHVRTKHYIAELKFQFDDPSDNVAILKNNPLGFYITHLSWSLDQDS